MRYCFLPSLHAGVWVRTGECSQPHSLQSQPYNLHCNLRKNGKNIQKYSASFVLLNCFSLAKIILVQILNSPVHSNDNTILCVLCASLAYKEQAIRVPVMIKIVSVISIILQRILKATVKFKWPFFSKKVNTTRANVYWFYFFIKSFNKSLNPVKRDAVCSICVFWFSWNIFIYFLNLSFSCWRLFSYISLN